MKSITIFFYLTILTFITSCGTNQEKKTETSDSLSNSISLHSTDINKLQQYLNLTIFKPDSVEFEYTFIANSAGNSRTNISGPSDYILQAVLYYDSITLKKIIALQKKVSVVQYNLAEFKFDWLNQDIIQELSNDINYYGIHSDTLFGTGNIKTLCLTNKILIEKSTN